MQNYKIDTVVSLALLDAFKMLNTWIFYLFHNFLFNHNNSIVTGNIRNNFTTRQSW